MRQHYKRRHEILHQQAMLLDPNMMVQRASAGFHTVGYFTDPERSEDAFVSAANAAGLTLSGIGRYCLEPIERKGVVIGYGAASETEIKQGMETMAELLS